MSTTSAPDPSQTTTPTPLPKLTDHEFRQYNRMSEHMNYFHNHFRSTWTILYTSATKSRLPPQTTLREFFTTGLQLCQQLEMHHGIEERSIFPVLAKKMPRFRKANSEHGELLRQHRLIHEGLEKLQGWLEEAFEELREGGMRERDVEWKELLGVMDGFKDVLWTHLDEEVEELGAENMRKYWTLEEMRRMPM